MYENATFKCQDREKQQIFTFEELKSDCLFCLNLFLFLPITQ